MKFCDLSVVIFHDQIGVGRVGDGPDVDQAGFAHHPKHLPAFTFNQFTVFVPHPSLESSPTMGAKVVIDKDQVP